MADNQNSSEENHRSALDDLLGLTPTKPVVEPVVTDKEPVVQPADAVVEPVVPVATEENTKPADAEPSNDYYQKLAEISEGQVKTEDDFKGILERAKKATDLESQFQTVAQERDTLKNAKPYANEYVQKLNELYQSGADANKINLFNRINQLPIADLSSKDAVKWHLMEKYNLTDSEAEIKLRSDYKTDPDLYSEEEISAANINLKIKGDEAKNYLKGLQASFETAAPEAVVQETPEQIAQKTLQYENQLNPIAKTIEQELPALFSKINVNGKQGDAAVTIDLPVPAEVQTNVIDQVKVFAKNNQMDLNNPEMVQGLKDYAANLTKIQMFEAWMIDASNKREESVRAEFHNPSTINRGSDNPAAPAKSSREASASLVASTM